ncbi:MAG: hypothetical protein PF904_11780 [Kiritimatiellae bacterium]|nr:hypothetical protein [Kiritimatiellia bacterium]
MFFSVSGSGVYDEKAREIKTDEKLKIGVPYVILAVFSPCRAITKGPKHHWFGYYDKLQFDPSCRYVLGMEVDFAGRSPKPDDVIKIGMVDLQDNDKWIELGSTHAWCWQQGCMLQWISGSDSEGYGMIGREISLSAAF